MAGVLALREADFQLNIFGGFISLCQFDFVPPLHFLVRLLSVFRDWPCKHISLGCFQEKRSTFLHPLPRPAFQKNRPPSLHMPQCTGKSLK